MIVAGAALAFARCGGAADEGSRTAPPPLPSAALTPSSAAQSPSGVVIGTGPHGTVLLIEDDDRPLRNRYVLLPPTGTTRAPVELGSARQTNAQEALMDPTCRLFTDGDRIIDLATRAVVGRIPRDAKVLVRWTRAGIVYLTAHGRTTWDPGDLNSA